MAIKALFIYIPVAVAIFQIVIMLFYKLDKEYDGIVEDLKNGKGAKEA